MLVVQYTGPCIKFKSAPFYMFLARKKSNKEKK